jgi:Flp pilus assembly pilin Flp
MFERISLKLIELVSELKREEGQGATEYAMVIGFLIITLVGGLGLLGVGINDFLENVADNLPVIGGTP